MCIIPILSRFKFALILVISSTLLYACGVKPKPAQPNLVQNGNPVRVSSKADTEGSLLGQIILQVLNANGIPTINKTQLGPTKTVRSALIDGKIDIYPEYTGNGAFMFMDSKNPAWKDAKLGYDMVKSLDFEKNQIVWLQSAPANNTWAIAVRNDVAILNHLKSLNDLSQWISNGGNFKLAASTEFVERSDAMPAIEKNYGFKLKPEQLLLLSGGDSAVFAKAALEQTAGVNAAMVYGTDGENGLMILSDSKSIQPTYSPTPLIRAEVLKAHPAIESLLKPVFSSLSTSTLQKLNGQITIEGKDAQTVAFDYLKSKGFIH